MQRIEIRDKFTFQLGAESVAALNWQNLRYEKNTKISKPLKQAFSNSLHMAFKHLYEMNKRAKTVYTNIFL